MLRRALAAAILLGAVVGLAWWLQDGPVPATTGGGPHGVEIVGPAGHPFWNGTVVLASNGTALAALEAAASRGNFTLGITHSFATLVTRIGPYEQDAVGGWNYCIGHTGAWSWAPTAADQRVLLTGQDVRWVWVTDGGNGCDAQ